MSRITLDGGKYTVISDGGVLTALRNGEPWRDMVGDKLVGAMFDEIETLRAALAERTQQEAQPFGYVTKTRTGVQHFYPDSPYLDNAVECVTVYSHPTSAANSTAPSPLMVDMVPPATSRDRWMYEQGRFAEREDQCARIKAADDAAADNDYMLDSNDCISVIRGTWKSPLANDCPPAAPASQAAGGEADFDAWWAENRDRLLDSTANGTELARRVWMELAAAPAAAVEPTAQAVIANAHHLTLEAAQIWQEGYAAACVDRDAWSRAYDEACRNDQMQYKLPPVTQNPYRAAAVEPKMKHMTLDERLRDLEADHGAKGPT